MSNYDIDQIGIKSYSKYSSGGQVTSKPIRGVTLFYPKDKDFPDIEISVSTERNQFKNKELAMEAFEKIMESI